MNNRGGRRKEEEEGEDNKNMKKSRERWKIINTKSRTKTAKISNLLFWCQ